MIVALVSVKRKILHLIRKENMDDCFRHVWGDVLMSDYEKRW
jgi:hypothetical protein